MKATRIKLFSFDTPPMRAFHVTWVAFFVCFFGWFAVAPLMPIIRTELHLTKAQIGNVLIASVAATVIARLLVGWLVDRYGPRRIYAGLLVIGALPIMGLGLAHDYTSFLLIRLAIGAVGASFVITQYHTSAMFAPNVVGTANATAAGWGNLGGGVTQMLMPLVFAGLMRVGMTQSTAWRAAMVLPGVLMLFAAVAYLTLTQDGPDGNQTAAAAAQKPKGAFLKAFADPRTWVLGMAYGACFGVELTVHNVAALYFHDRFNLGLEAAGMVAGSFGVLALFARALGGYTGDKVGQRLGLKGRVATLASVLAAEGVLLVVFSRMNYLPLAIVTLILFGLFTHMSAGSTYAVTPFVRRDAVGAVAGVVGAGGNLGAVLAGFLFRSDGMAAQTAFLVLGACVLVSSALVLLVRFKSEDEVLASSEMARIRAENAVAPAAAPAE